MILHRLMVSNIEIKSCSMLVSITRLTRNDTPCSHDWIHSPSLWSFVYLGNWSFIFENRKKKLFARQRHIWLFWYGFTRKTAISPILTSLSGVYGKYQYLVDQRRMNLGSFQHLPFDNVFEFGVAKMPLVVLLPFAEPLTCPCWDWSNADRCDNFVDSPTSSEVNVIQSYT